jgi:tetratricopeptide (TPR) repeat protein
MTARTIDDEVGSIYSIQFIDRGEVSDLPAPLVRLSTCGCLMIEVLEEVLSFDPPQARYRRLSPDNLRGRGIAPALTFLKLLLSQPRRYAKKDFLREHLSRLDEEAATDDRVDDVASLLRGLLYPSPNKETPEDRKRRDKVRKLLVAYVHGSKGSGGGFCLGEYPLVWVDTDALAYHVTFAARMDRFRDPNALPSWERAYHLASGGPYLPDEVYSDWTNGLREEVEGYLRQSVHALSRLYLACYGEAGEEELQIILRNYWLAHKTDEDVLRPLMELLGKQERYGEALDYYTQCEAALQEQELTKGDTPCLPDERTCDIAEYLRTKQIQRERATSLHSSEASPTSQIGIECSTVEVNKAIHLESTNIGEKVLFLSPPLSPFTSVSDSSLNKRTRPERLFLTLDQMLSTIHGGVWSGMSVAQAITEIDDWNGRAAFCHELQVILRQRIRMADQMRPASSSEENRNARREFLVALGTLPLALFTSLQQGRRSEIQIEALLPRCAASLTTCWHLVNEADLPLVEQLLNTFLPTIETIAQQYSKYQQIAANLATQGYLMQAILALHRLEFSMREAYCLKAVYYSSAAEDYRLQAAALMYLGYTYCYNQQPEQAITAFQRALRCLGQQQSLLQSDIYMGLAYAHARCKDEHAARDTLVLAQKYFPPYPEHDPSYLYASCSMSSLSIWEGRTYTALGEHYPDRGYHQYAWDALAQIAGTQPTSERDRTEIIIVQAQAAIGKRDLEMVHTYLDMGLEAAETLGSKRRISEACNVYLQMWHNWSGEPQTQTLAKRFQPFLPEGSMIV